MLMSILCNRTREVFTVKFKYFVFLEYQICKVKSALQVCLKVSILINAGVVE